MKIKIDLKNRERVALAMSMEQPDLVPIDFSLGNQFNYMHGWLGLDGKRFILDPAYTLDAEIKFIETFNIEGILGPVYGLAIEPSLFGCADIIIPRDTSPWVIGHLNTVSTLI